MTEFLEHYFDTRSILLEVNRVLKSGGLVFGTVPFIWHLHELPHDEYRFTPISLEKHLRNAGFINIEILPLGGVDSAMAQMLGLWFSLADIKGRRVIKPIVFSIYKWLLKKDRIFENFDTGRNSMYNGLSFIARKA